MTPAPPPEPCHALSTARGRVPSCALALTLALLGPTALCAQDEAPGAGVYVPTPTTVPAHPPELAGRSAAIPPLERLPDAVEAAREALKELREWNRRGRPPLRNGFTRRLARPRTVSITSRSLPSRGARAFGGGLLTVDSGWVSWLAAVEVESAHALRIHLGIDSLPEGAEIWTWGAGGEPQGPFGEALLGPDGDLWLPPVEGPRVAVEVGAPLAAIEAGGALVLRIEEVMELVDLGAEEGTLSVKAATPCEIDGRCVGPATLGAIDDFRHAVARLLFSKSGFSYLCSGSLINDWDASSAIPYLLTANHCFSSQASASSLIAYFDYFPATCGGIPPSLGSLPKVTGATLLATNPQSDFTLVRLSALPAGYNYFLGWTTRLLADGEVLYMLSHPEGRRQAFSTTGFEAAPAFNCGSVPFWLYAHQLSGSTLGGSSGAPAIVPENGGQIVGQLFGVCYSPPDLDDCDYDTFSEVDGAFRTTFNQVAPWLAGDPATVTVQALDPLASEPSEDGAFRIHRSPATALPLEVSFTLGGTALKGTDYAAPSSPVTIAAGASSVDVPVAVIDDTEPEPDEHVTLTLLSSSQYLIGSPSGATVILADDDGADDCGTVAVSGTILTGTEEVSACARLDAGPDLSVGAGAEVGLFAGRVVVLHDGFGLAPGATLRVGTCGQDLCAPGLTNTPLEPTCHPCVSLICATDAHCCDSDWDFACVAAVGSICALPCP